MFPLCVFVIVIAQSLTVSRNAYRTSSEEKRAADRLNEGIIQELRLGAEVHRTVRKYAQSYIKPGMRMIDICERIENATRTLIVENGLKVAANFACALVQSHELTSRFRQALVSQRDAR